MRYSLLGEKIPHQLNGLGMKPGWMVTVWKVFPYFGGGGENSSPVVVVTFFVLLGLGEKISPKT